MLFQKKNRKAKVKREIAIALDTIEDIPSDAFLNKLSLKRSNLVSTYPIVDLNNADRLLSSFCG